MAKYQSKFELLINASSGGAKRVLTNLQNELGKTGKEGKSATSMLSSGWAQAGMAIGAVTAAAYGLKRALDFAVEGEKIRNIGLAFGQLNENATATGRALQSMLRGTVDQTSMQMFANQLSTMGIEAEQMGVLADSAFKIAATQGRKTIDVMNTLATAIGTGRLATAAQFGIVVDAKEAQKQYADSLGVTESALDATAKRQALVNALLAEAERKFGAIDVSTLGVKMQQQQTRMANVWSDINEGFGVFGNAIFTAADQTSDAWASVIFAITDSKTAFVEHTNIMPEFVRQNEEAAAAAAQLEAEERKLLAVEEARVRSLKIILEATGRQMPVLLDEAKLLDSIRKTWTPINDLMEANVSVLEKRKAKIDALLPSIDAEIDRLGAESDGAKALLRWRDLELAKLKDLIPLRQKSEAAAKAQADAQEALNGAVRGFMSLGLAGELDRTIKGFNKGTVSALEMFAVFKSGAEQTGLKGLTANLSAGLNTLVVARKKFEDDMEKKGSGGGGSRVMPDPQTISKEAATLRLKVLGAQDELSRITAQAELERFNVEQQYREKGISEDLQTFELKRIQMQEETALAKVAADDQARIAQEAAKVEQGRLQAQAGADRARQKAQDDLRRQQQDDLRTNANDIQASIEAARSGFDALAESGVESMGRLSAAMGEARTVAEYFNQAVVLGFEQSQAAMPGAIAAGGRLAGALISNDRARAAVRGAFEVAAGWGAIAAGQPGAAAAHFLSSALFFSVAGKGKKASGSASGANAQGSAGTAANAPAQLNQGGSNVNTTTVINLNGFLGTKQELGSKITEAQNSIAGLGHKIDPRLIGTQQMGF